MASDPEYPAVPPGFVDLQINGWNGVDFSSAELTPDAAATAFDAIVSTGTAAFLPTVVTSDMPTYTRVIPVLARLVQASKQQLANVLDRSQQCLGRDCIIR